MSISLFFKNIWNDFKDTVGDFKHWIIEPTDELKMLRNNFLIYLLVFLILIIFTVLFFYYSDNKIKFSVETFIYTIIIIIPIVCLFYFLKPHMAEIINNTNNITNTDNSNKETASITIFISLFIFLVVSIYLFTNITPREILIGQYLFLILLGFIIIVGLAILFLMFINYFKKMTGWTGFFMRLLFYIPCLFIDFIQFIKSEMKITANNVYILFILELLLILGYIYLPKILTKFTLNNAVIILNDSKFLNKEYTLINDKLTQLPKKTKDDSEQLVYRQNYAISMWVYIDPQSNNYKSYSKESNIIDMNNSNPKITYINDIDDNYKKDKIIIYIGNNKYSFSNQGQKWNNIVINCNSTIIDIFINGNLEKTFNLTQPFDYTNSEKITLGSNDGLDGAICNIIYYNNSLSKNQITNAYNLLIFSNPPIIQ